MVVRRALLLVTALALAVNGATLTAEGSVASFGPVPALTVSTVLGGVHRPWDIAFTS